METKARVIGDLEVQYGIEDQFRVIYDEVFGWQDYRFTCDREDPLILDCGAHIGLSVLYFKTLYPRARVVAFEPNVANLRHLRHNVEVNGLTGVEIVEAAVFNVEGEVELRGTIGESWANSLIYSDEDDNMRTIVRATRLSPYITEPVAYIKLDIERAEGVVIEDIEEKLEFVGEIGIEFHTGELDTGDPARIMSILRAHGFSFELIHRDYPSPPLLRARNPRTQLL